MSNTALAQKIFESVQSLPDTQAREVLEWQNAQQPAMNHLWDNEMDETWNEVSCDPEPRH